MRKLLGTIMLAAVLAGCGEKSAEEPSGTPVPGTTPPEAHSDEAHAQARTKAKKESLAAYSEGVRAFYGQEAITEPIGDEHIDIEIEYHQPPRPAPGEAKLGEALTLTGTQIGVRLVAKVEKVHSAGGYTAVDVSLQSTGITIHDDEFREAALTYDDGKVVRPVTSKKAARVQCSNGFTEVVRIEVGFSAEGCFLFPKSGDAKPEQFQLALENVPYDAGGIWKLP